MSDMTNGGGLSTPAPATHRQAIIPPTPDGERPEIVEFTDSWPGVAFTEAGLVFNADLDRDTFEKVGRFLGSLNNKSKLWIADWLIYAEQREWGHTYDELLDITNLSQETLQNYASIGRRVPIQNRIAGSNMSMYAAVASLPHRDQKTVLQKAVDEGWDRDMARAAVKKIKGGEQAEAVGATFWEDLETAANLTPALGLGKQKPKTNRAGDPNVSQALDRCQTPPYALEPLLPYLNKALIVWEPAAGERLLAGALWDAGVGRVEESDILDGRNFFDYEPSEWDCLVTNPPYSIKYDWLKRCYALGKPFALLLPVETLGAKTAQELFRLHGVQAIFMDKRINFKMPNIGFEGSAAQFPVAWFTWQLNLEKDMVFSYVNPA